MARFATIIRSTYVTVLTVGLVVAGAASFAAYEAKVVQVKAVVENALVLDVDSVDFGRTIYPTVATSSPIRIGLSDSFMADTEMDGVWYTIHPKPKVKYPCGVPGYGYGTSTSSCPDPNKNPVPGDPWAEITVGDFTGYAWEYCETRMPQDASTTDDIFYTVDLSNDYWKYCYLPMGSWIGMHKDPVENYVAVGQLPHISTDQLFPVGPDRELIAFHEPYTYQWDMNGTSTIAATSIGLGKLSKADNDVVDSWNPFVLAPCFVKQCKPAADVPSPGYWLPGISPSTTFEYAVPFTSRLDPKTEHLVYGTDLWIEVGTGYIYATTSTSTP